MKRLTGLILAIMFSAPVAQAMNLVYQGVMVSTNGSVTEAAKASTQTYTMDVNASGGDIISLQLAVASATVPSVSFTDGRASTFTVTVVSTTGITGAKASDTITVSDNTKLKAHYATATITVSSNGVSALNGKTLDVHDSTMTMGTDFAIGASSAATAVNMMNRINAVVPGVFASTSSPGVVTIVTLSSGTAMNSYTLASSTTALTLVAFAGGLDNIVFAINGSSYTNQVNWQSVDTASGTAVAIKNFINTLGLNVTASTSASTVVTMTAKSSGTYANAYTLTTSSAAILGVGGATFSGGVNAGVFGIGGKYFTAGSDYAVGASVTATALNIAAMLNALSGGVAVATNTAGVVSGTMSVVGDQYNYALYSSTQSALTIAPYTSSSTVTGAAIGTMTTGAASGYSLAAPTVINITAHGLTTGYGVWVSTTNNVIPAPLVFGTTYYAIRLGANSLSLATSLANAQAGTAIVLTSSRTATTTATFTLNTIGLSGTPLFTLEASDNGSNWQAVTLGNYGATVSAVSFATPYASTAQLWDLGIFTHRYLRLRFSGPTTGGVAFTATINQKNNKQF